jgi:hypothetical protein
LRVDKASLALFLGLAAVLAGGCRQYALVGRDDAAAVTAFDAGPPYDGPSYVDGRVQGHAVFDYVDSVYWFGGDNDPSRIAVWIYQDQFTCQALSTPWVETVRPTDVMGFTIGGTKPGAYTVEPRRPPAPGRAYVLHEVDQADPVIDSVGQSGIITVTDVQPGKSVSGWFNLTFETGTLDGRFTGTWCPTGISLDK